MRLLTCYFRPVICRPRGESRRRDGLFRDTLELFPLVSIASIIFSVYFIHTDNSKSGLYTSTMIRRFTLDVCGGAVYS